MPSKAAWSWGIWSSFSVLYLVFPGSARSFSLKNKNGFLSHLQHCYETAFPSASEKKFEIRYNWFVFTAISCFEVRKIFKTMSPLQNVFFSYKVIHWACRCGTKPLILMKLIILINNALCTSVFSVPPWFSFFRVIGAHSSMVLKSLWLNQGNKKSKKPDKTRLFAF